MTVAYTFKLTPWAREKGWYLTETNTNTNHIRKVLVILSGWWKHSVVSFRKRIRSYRRLSQWWLLNIHFWGLIIFSEANGTLGLFSFSTGYRIYTHSHNYRGVCVNALLFKSDNIFTSLPWQIWVSLWKTKYHACSKKKQQKNIPDKKHVKLKKTYSNERRKVKCVILWYTNLRYL